jgi:DNA/RNA-binding domain of Phe-tRNA-synthetase-like protein
MSESPERDPALHLADSEGSAVPERGWVSDDVSDELAGVGVHYLLVERGSGRSPREVKDRLKLLAGRFSGAQAVNLRHQAIPWAYRVFFRHIGLDPDEQRTPVEEVALQRMRKGGFPSVSLLDDALTIAIAESGVAVRAFDADRVEGRLGIRLSAPGEPLEGRPGELPNGTLVIADDVRPLALLFGATGADRGVSSKTKRTLLCAIQVRGVPDIAVEEALWLAAGVMRG